MLIRKKIFCCFKDNFRHNLMDLLMYKVTFNPCRTTQPMTALKNKITMKEKFIRILCKIREEM